MWVFDVGFGFSVFIWVLTLVLDFWFRIIVLGFGFDVCFGIWFRIMVLDCGFAFYLLSRTLWGIVVVMGKIYSIVGYDISKTTSTTLPT